MEIIEVNGNKYIDQELKDYIDNIWKNYESVNIPEDSNIMFAKNTTVNRLITDYQGKDIRRVIKKEKCEYFIVNRFDWSSSKSFYKDGQVSYNIPDGSNKDEYKAVYGIHNNSVEINSTIESILDFHTRGQEVKYVSQNKLNDAMNNGTIIDEDNCQMFKELIDSNDISNNILAYNMIKNSSLKDNWQWILYLYHNKYQQLKDIDARKVIINYITDKTSTSEYYLNDVFSNFDKSMKFIKDKNIIDRFIALKRQEFSDDIDQYFKLILKTTKFKLKDYILEYIE